MNTRLRQTGCMMIALLLAGEFGCGTGFEDVPGPPTVETEAAAPVGLTSGTLHGRVNPNGGATTTWFEWAPDLTYGNSTTTRSIGSGTDVVSVNEPLNLLIPNQVYYYRAVAKNGSGTVYGDSMSFTTPAPQAPDVATGAPSVITQTGCTFNGTVNPHGAATMGWFEWGTDANYGAATLPQSLGNGSLEQAFGQPVTGLTASMTYHFRAAADNAAGMVFGQDEVCTTLTVTTNPPAVTTEPATEIAPTAVTLNGTINPVGMDAFGRFEWGPTEAYGNVTAEQYMGNGSSTVPLSLRLAGLIPTMDYHFRAIGRGDGEAAGQDQSFTTLTASIPSRLYLSENESSTSSTENDRIVVIDPNPTVHNDVTNTDDPNPNYNQQIGNVAITGKDPAELAAHPDGITVYSMVGNNLTVINVLTNVELTSLSGVGGASNNHVVVSADGKKLYLAYRPTVSTLLVKVYDLTDSAAPTLLTTISNPLFDGCSAPLGLAVKPDGSRLYLACRPTSSSLPDRFYMVETATNTVTQTATFSRDSTNYTFINALAVKPDGSQVYMARTDSTLSTVEVFDGATGAKVGSIPLPANALPRAGVVSPDGSKLYVVDQRLGIHVIDTGSNTPLLTMDSTTSRGFDIAITLDGSRVYTTLGDAVFVNTTATNSWLTTITGDFISTVNLTLTPGHP